MTDDVPDALKVQKDLLWGMYSDIRTHARHAETLRANAVNVVLVVASALVALVTNDGQVQRSELAMCLVVAFVGLFGLAFAAAYSELYRRNRLRAEKIRDVLDERYFDGAPDTIAGVLDASDAPHEASRFYRATRGLTGSTQRFWVAIPTLVVVAGIVLAGMAV